MEKGISSNERVIIENVLHQIITLIDEGEYPEEQKKQMKEEAYKEFLKRESKKEGLPAFKTMSVEELKAEYKKFTDSLKKQKER